MNMYNLQLNRQMIYDLIKAHYDVTAVGRSLTDAITYAEIKCGLNRVAACILDQMYNVKLSLEELRDTDPELFCELVSLYSDNFELEGINYGDDYYSYDLYRNEYDY